MAADRQNHMLQTIFSFFLGIMVLAFIAVGVNTFYTAPEQAAQKEIDKVDRQMQRYNVKDPASLTPAEQAAQQRLQDELNRLNDALQAKMEIWMRNTSVIVVIFATLVMAVSLIRSEQLRLISNGLLLGGLFTMIYGTGWVIFSGNAPIRFGVIFFALAMTIGLGYMKFVMEKKAKVVPVEGAEGEAAEAASTAALGGFEARLAALEERVDAASRALGSGPRDPAG